MLNGDNNSNCWNSSMGFEIIGVILILTVPTGIWNGK